MLLELINEFNDFSGYKVSIQKNFIFVCNNEKSKKEIKKYFHLNISKNKIIKNKLNKRTVIFIHRMLWNIVERN